MASGLLLLHAVRQSRQRMRMARKMLRAIEHDSDKFTVSGSTAVGKVREINEDAFCVSDRIWAVSDGMGGHRAGDVAAAICVAVCDAAGNDDDLVFNDIGKMIIEANESVRREAERSGSTGMGATLVGVALVDNGGERALVTFNVGDSRCYEIVGEEPIRQITKDHSFVQELVDSGEVAPEDAASHPQRNVITRGIGIDEHVQADLVVLDRASRRLVLCSDGVSGELSDARLEEISRSAEGTRDAAEAILAASLEGPARDNATVLVVDVAIDPADHSALIEEVTGPRPDVQKTVTVPSVDVDRGSAVSPGSRSAESLDEIVESLISSVPNGPSQESSVPSGADPGGSDPDSLIREIPS